MIKTGIVRNFFRAEACEEVHEVALGRNMMIGRSILSSQLEYFLIVYQSKSYATAARLIPMSTQGLIKSMHTLEDILDAPLFESSGSASLKPTDYADKLFDMVQEWRKDTKELEEVFRQIKCNSVKTLRLGAAVGTLGVLGIDFPELFSKKHPTIRVQCVEVPDLLVENHLASGEYNLALTVAPFDEAFDTVSLFSSNVYAWVSNSNPLSQRNILSVSDFDGQKIGVVDSSFKVHKQLMDAFEKAGIHPSSIATTAEIFRLYSYARTKHGIGLSASHLKNVFPDTHVAFIPVEGVQWEFGLSTRKGYAPTDDERKLVDYLAAKARTLAFG